MKLVHFHRKCVRWKSMASAQYTDMSHLQVLQISKCPISCLSTQTHTPVVAFKLNLRFGLNKSNSSIQCIAHISFCWCSKMFHWRMSKHGSCAMKNFRRLSNWRQRNEYREFMMLWKNAPCSVNLLALPNVHESCGMIFVQLSTQKFATDKHFYQNIV